MNQIEIKFDFRNKHFSIDPVELKLAYKLTQTIIEEFSKELNEIQEKKKLIHPNFILIFGTASFAFYFLAFFQEQLIYAAYLALFLLIGTVAMFWRDFIKLQNSVQVVCENYFEKLKEFYVVKNNFNLSNGLHFANNKVILEKIEQAQEILLETKENVSEIVIMRGEEAKKQEIVEEESLVGYKYLNLPETRIEKSRLDSFNLSESGFSEEY